MHRIVIIFLAIYYTSPAYADTPIKNRIDVLCSGLEKQKKEDKNVEYVPGVDIHGNSVTPADLQSTKSPYLDDPIVIPIEIDLIERYGLTDLPTGIEMDAQIANLKIHADGRIEYNDQNVTPKIEKLCQDRRQEKDNPVPSSNLKKEKASSDKIEGQYP